MYKTKSLGADSAGTTAKTLITGAKSKGIAKKTESAQITNRQPLRKRLNSLKKIDLKSITIKSKPSRTINFTLCTINRNAVIFC